MDDDRHGDLMLEECHIQEEEFLREILGEPGFSSETETHHHNNFTTPTDAHTLTMVASKSKTSSSPRTYILSFDSSAIIPATPQPPSPSTLSANKRHQNLNPEQPKPKSTTQTGKRARNGSVDHIMAERKRRQELTQRFIALSATIPGLKKVTCPFLNPTFLSLILHIILSYYILLLLLWVSIISVPVQLF